MFFPAKCLHVSLSVNRLKLGQVCSALISRSLFRQRAPNAPACSLFLCRCANLPFAVERLPRGRILVRSCAMAPPLLRIGLLPGASRRACRAVPVKWYCSFCHLVLEFRLCETPVPVKWYWLQVPLEVLHIAVKVHRGVCSHPAQYCPHGLLVFG